MIDNESAPAISRYISMLCMQVCQMNECMHVGACAVAAGWYIQTLIASLGQVRVLPGNILSISGKRVVEESGGGDADGSRRYERRFMGAFQRSFSLPDNVDANGISAKVRAAPSMSAVPPH